MLADNKKTYENVVKLLEEELERQRNYEKSLRDLYEKGIVKDELTYIIPAACGDLLEFTILKKISELE